MLLTSLKRRLAALFKRDKLEQELDEELRYHLERDAEQNQKFGMDQNAAQYAALKAFGNVESSKEECRDARGIKFLDDLLRDIRYSLRLLVKNPTFSFVAILTLALGIGANSAIFSLVDAVLLRSLPVKEPQNLVLFGNGIDLGSTDGFPNDSPDLFSYPFYKDVQQAGMFSDVGALLSIGWTVHGLAGSHDVVPRRMEVQLVSGSYFPVLGIDPGRGRLITEEDDKVPGMHPVAVVSDAWWRQQFGGSDNVIGESIRIDKTAYTIIGVAPKGFTGTTVGQAPDVWIPLAMEPQIPPHWNGRDKRNFQSLFLIGRLSEGASREQATAAVNVLYKRFLQDLAGPQPSAEVQQRMNAAVELTPVGKGINGVRRDFALPLRVLTVVVAIILLIACANIANLLLARAAVRKREIVLRLALGARRISLIRQFITESLILALIAGAAGVILAWWGTHLLVAMASSGPRPLPLDVTLNVRVLGFTLLVSVLSAVIFGGFPALRATRGGDLNATLKDGKGALRPSAQNRLGRSLVVAQVALSLMLMIGAGLFVRTLSNLESLPTGFDAQNVVLFNIDTASTGYNGEQIAKLQVEAEERVRQVPGVEASAFSFLVFNQGGWTSTVYTRDETPPQGEARVVRQNVIGEEYFKAMGVQLVSGRVFNRFDTAQSQKVAVVSETMAQHFYPNTSPLGKHFGKSAQFPDAVEIIGVVKDVKYHSLTEVPRPMVYFSLSQMPQPVNNFVVRVSSDSVIPAVRQALRNVNSNLPIDDVVSLEDHVSRSLAQQKLVARVASFFGLLALVLASIGLYGVLAYAVAQRRNEIGIRVALGASSADVLKLILRNGMTLTVIGLVLGVGGALALTRLVATLLFGVTPTDLLTFVGVSLTLIVVALLACYIPARMATQVDPLTALRDE